MLAVFAPEPVAIFQMFLLGELPVARPMSKQYPEQGAAPESVVHVETGVVLAHEERLQRLEHDRIDIAARLAEGSQMMMNLARLTEEGFGRVEKRQAEIGEQVASLVRSNEDRDEKIKKVTEVIDKRAARIKWVKKNFLLIVVGVLSATAGVFGKSIGEFLVSAFR